MDAYISLYIYPQRIDSEKWKKIYEETVSVLPYCSFMDSYCPEGSKHNYACRTSHRGNLVGEDCGGWRVHGDIVSGIQMPPVCLYDDIECYKYRKADPEKETDTSRGENGALKIWDLNTAGAELRLQLLAIAILIRTRLPEAVDVSSAAKAEDYRQAAGWINWLVDRPLNLYDIPEFATADHNKSTEPEVTAAEYDIECIDYLRDYYPGDTIAPEIEAGLIERFREMYCVSTKTIDEVLALTEGQRRAWFDEHYSICISKKCEDMIYDFLNDDRRLAPYIALYATADSGMHYAALCNRYVLEKYWDMG